MCENRGIQALREVLQPLPSGPRLAAALEGANLANSDIPALISAVLGEKLAAASGGGAAAPKKAGGASAEAGGAAPAAPAERACLDDALCVFDSLQFINPRGKQQLVLCADQLVVRTPKQDVAVPWGAIRHVAIIDSIPGDTKGKVLLYLHVDSAHTKVYNGKTLVTALVIQTTADAELDVAHPQGGGRLRGPAPVVLCQALGAVPGGLDPACFVSPDADYFRSADKATGVGAHVGAKSGFLYPLPAALVFLESPALFLPHSALRSVELMRAGGASATFDLVLHLRSGKTQEFSFIARQEAAGLEDYIRKCRLAVGAAESDDDEEEAAAGGEAEAEAEDSDDDSEDEDFAPTSSSSEDEAEGSQPQPGGGKRKRGGSADAGAEGASAGGSGSEGEDDEEEEAEDGSSSEEEDSSDDEEDDGSVELVSEDDFSLQELESVAAAQAESGGGGGGRRAKRART